MKIHSISLLLFPLEDLHLGFGVQQGNLLPSLPYIPGRVLRGALANWAIRNGLVRDDQDPLFREVFVLKEEQAGTPEVSFPVCTYSPGKRPLFTAPFSLFAFKGAGEDGPPANLVRGDRKSKLPYPGDLQTGERVEATAGAQPIDFLCRSPLWPSEIGTDLKPFEGTCDALGFAYDGSFPLRVDARSRHVPEENRVKEDGLFFEQAIPAASPRKPLHYCYSGELRFPESEQMDSLFSNLIDPHHDAREGILVPRLRDPDPRRLLFLGHRRVPTLVLGKPMDVRDPEEGATRKAVFKLMESEDITLTFLSDFAPVGRPTYPLTAEMLEHHIFSPQISGAPESHRARPAHGASPRMKQKRVFCRPGVLHGWNVAGGEPALPLRTLAAGSCIHIDLKGRNLSKEEAHALLTSSLLGMGRRSQDGLGRFMVNHPIHRVSPAKGSTV